MIAGNQSMDINELPLYPVLGCNCGNQDTLLMDNLQYRRNARNLSLRKVRCQKCGDNAHTKVYFKPDQAFSRITGINNFGVFAQNNIPYQKGSFASAIIQYSKKLNHFRTIKLYGKQDMKIYDNSSIKSIRNKDQRRYAVDGENGNWTNYIVLQHTVSREDIDHVKLKEIKKFSYFNNHRQICGKSFAAPNLHQVKCVQWNVRSGSQRSHKLQKLTLIKQQKPAIISINQSRQSWRIPHYNCFQAKPSQQQNRVDKLNCSLFIHEEIDSELVASEQDFVAAIIKLHLSIVLVISVYIKSRISNQQKIVKINQIFQQYSSIIQQRNQPVSCLVMGDFNSPMGRYLRTQMNLVLHFQVS